MTALYDLDALRPLSLFAPDVRRLAVTIEAEPEQVGLIGPGRKRSAEVLFVLRRDGLLLLIHKAAYPPDTYRLPTGGLEPDETPRQAAVREIYEETGYRVAAPGLLGVVEYTLHWPGFDPAPFVSYVFLAQAPPDQSPRPADPAERIAAYRWLPAAHLDEVAAHLRALPPDWLYWGRFRAASYAFIAHALAAYTRSTT